MTDRNPAAFAKRPPAFADRALAWWDENGRKDLPWQQPRTPYRVWISEIMLQQTQVTTVIPYFERWMEAFPDLATLASAPLDEVLAHWSGLGYYARARNLHAAAVRCAGQHGGELPLDPGQLRKLPGIGASTANAIVSQSTDRPAAVLDGNVRRLLARHAAIEGWAGQASVQKSLWREAEERLPTSRGADYTQAVMDLGALVCTRGRPCCTDCPVNDDCRALQRGLVERLPSPRPKTRVGERELVLLVCRDELGRVLLEQRPPAGIWGGLWCLPDGASLGEIEQRLGLEAGRPAELPARRHRLSHLRLSLRPLLTDATVARQVQCPAGRGWFGPREWNSLGLPKPVSDLLNELEKGEHG